MTSAKMKRLNRDNEIRRVARESPYLRQVDLAERFGISQQQIQRILAKGKKPELASA
jgi:DNA-binding transcriptional regulator LsrR (DeoR family)